MRAEGDGDGQVGAGVTGRAEAGARSHTDPVRLLTHQPALHTVPLSLNTVGSTFGPP
ncbi:hypothetical protein Pen01_67130 [Phytomonospora endophytica]|nr:hypothetical protein Pen01_67130 [Phytomonospora endophytica]